MSEMGKRYQEEQRREMAMWREQNRLDTLLCTHVDRLLEACFVGDKRRMISGPSLRRDLERLAREAYQQGYTDGVHEGGVHRADDAAERALLDRLAKRILAEIVYCAPENRALAEEIARVARIETDLIVTRDDATSGTAHDTALRD